MIGAPRQARRVPAGVGKSRRAASGPTPLALVALLVALGFVAVSALPSGLLMMALPDGSGFGLPGPMLDGTPFTTFMVPGALLFTFLGLLPLAALWLSWTDRRHAWARGLERVTGSRVGWLAAGASGVAMVVWIATEIAMIGGPHALQVLYGAIGIAVVVLALTPTVRAWSRIAASG